MMRTVYLLFAVATGVFFVEAAGAAQYPIMEKVASKIVQKYQTSSCQDLWQEKMQKQGQPKSDVEDKAIQLLRNDPQMRNAFIDRIAAPVANKMFECGMIP
jgi:hypothetical protein